MTSYGSARKLRNIHHILGLTGDGQSSLMNVITDIDILLIFSQSNRSLQKVVKLNDTRWHVLIELEDYPSDMLLTPSYRRRWTSVNRHLSSSLPLSKHGHHSPSHVRWYVCPATTRLCDPLLCNDVPRYHIRRARLLASSGWYRARWPDSRRIDFGRDPKLGYVLFNRTNECIVWAKRCCNELNTIVISNLQELENLHLPHTRRRRSWSLRHIIMFVPETSGCGQK